VNYNAPTGGELGLNQFAYGGRWRVGPESATAAGEATLSLSFQARKVFLVLGSHGGPANVEVLLDGRPIADAVAGDDVSGGTARIARQRLYRLVDLHDAGRHALELRFDPGISGYAFTFG
jgi:hypothetical protein